MEGRTDGSVAISLRNFVGEGITNFKQMTRVEIILTNLYNTLRDYILCMTSRLFVAVHSIALLTLLT